MRDTISQNKRYELSKTFYFYLFIFICNKISFILFVVLIWDHGVCSPQDFMFDDPDAKFGELI